MATVVYIAVLLLLGCSHQTTDAQHIRTSRDIAGGANPMYSAADIGGGFKVTVKGDTVFGTHMTRARAPPNPLPCTCTDVEARPTFITRPNYTCWEHYKWGQCNETFMFDTIEELFGGYCQITCGRCKCCPTLEEAALSSGATEFVWALNRTSGWLEPISQPGLYVTLLAPTNGAMEQLYGKLGGKSKIESDQATRDTLTSVLALHHLLPEPYYDATWTTPFFAPGVKLATLNKDADLTIGPTSSQGYIVLQGPRNSANILTKDVYACMGYVNVIDTVLLPFDLDGSRIQQTPPPAPSASSTPESSSSGGGFDDERSPSPSNASPSPAASPTSPGDSPSSPGPSLD